MFNMNQVGINICRLRKSMGMTQMEMADKLGISFQAVSNWERGVSMPNISKLHELSALFHVSIDGILENKRTSEIAKNLLKNRPMSDISIEEIQEMAPILHDEQVDILVEEKNADLNEVLAVAPFLSQEFIDNFAKKELLYKNSLSSIEALAPFISTSIIDEASLQTVEQTGDLSSITALAPFISDDLLDRLADIFVQKTGGFASRPHSSLCQF